MTPSDKLYSKVVDGVELPAIDDGQELRVLGCLPPPEGMTSASPTWSDFIAGQTWELREVDWREHCGEVDDQDGLGACVGYAGASAYEQAWSMAGLPPTSFDPDFAYACVNGGWDRGAYLEEMIKSLATNGLPPRGSIPRYTYQMAKIPQAVRDVAKNFVVAKSFLCRTFLEALDACSRGFAISFGITIGTRFTVLDAGGVCGFGIPRGGHAVHGVGVRKIKAGPYKGRWGLDFKNSWRKDYGDQGYGTVVEEHFSAGANSIYAIQAPHARLPQYNPPIPATLVA
ncbi:C1 family peptidase [Paludisphaera soli]|uniref:C1 family peptidase n=1 Tax=Paludisphaera soli TaxID=2712865 RepID=UPI0013EB681D|nr:C1 family peptidase [Paludisphaera soli]